MLSTKVENRNGGNEKLDWVVYRWHEIDLVDLGCHIRKAYKMF